MTDLYANEKKICEDCGVEFGDKIPGKEVEWIIGECRICRETDLITDVENFEQLVPHSD